MKKIYLVTANYNIGYDEYDSCIVIAKNEEHAMQIAQLKCGISKSVIEYIGKADKSQEYGLVLGSFNAG